MTKTFKLMMGVAAAAIVAMPALAATESITQKTSTVNPDGSVSYESHTVVKDAPTSEVVVPAVTFYYYDTTTKHITASSDLSEQVFAIWDKDKNRYIDNHEYYNNEMVMYEPLEYSKRSYQDVDMDGKLELTQEEYTLRLQKLPLYTEINTDKKDGISVYEFSGIGFQEADGDDDNQVSYDELKKAFYGQNRLASNPDLYNK